MTGWSKEVFAKNLQSQMDKHGKSQKEIAKIVGVSAPTVSEWLSCKKYPRIDKIEILANYFGILKSDLIEKPTADLASAKEIGNLVKEARTKKGYSRKALAEQAELSENAIAKLEKGDNPNMTMEKIKLIANILELNPLLLLGFKDLGKQPKVIVVSENEFSKKDFAQIEQFIQFMRNKQIHSKFTEFMKKQK